VTQLIMQYVRHKKRGIIGMVVAIPREEGFGIGWSLCCKTDGFDRKQGLTKAVGRAKGTTVIEPAQSVQHVFDKVLNRAKKYFKGSCVQQGPPSVPF
jgi:hypothetical protein